MKFLSSWPAAILIAVVLLYALGSVESDASTEIDDLNQTYLTCSAVTQVMSYVVGDQDPTVSEELGEASDFFYAGVSPDYRYLYHHYVRIIKVMVEQEQSSKDILGALRECGVIYREEVE